CDMIVELAYAREHGLTIEYPEREYGFCSAGCLETFAKNRSPYVAKVDAWFADKAGAHASGPDAPTRSSDGAVPEIDAGMRAWYAFAAAAYPTHIRTSSRRWTKSAAGLTNLRQHDR